MNCSPTELNASNAHHEPASGKRYLRYPLVLASGSPRRKELMASLGLAYEIIVSPVDESAFNLDHLPPADFVKFLARTKAQEVFKYRADSYVVGADTVVVLDGEIFGKPADADDACRMLSQLQGRAHEVYSGICVFNPDQAPDALPIAMDARCTKVFMRAMTEDEIGAYVATGEPMDKAGSYAIQGLGAALIERVEGCYFNVVGLSLNQLDTLFGQFGEKLVL